MAKKTSKKAGSKKKSTKRKTTGARKASASKSTRATSASRKTSARKTTKKKTPARKSTASKSAASKTKTRKSTAAKPAAKKPASKKTSKKATAPKSAKDAEKKSSKKPAGKSKKSDAKARSAATAENSKPDAAVAPPTITLTDARAAASRLAAAAGLPSLKLRTPEAIAETVAEKRLTKSPLNKRDLEKYREILQSKRGEVAGDVFDMESEALGAGKGELSSLPQHMADQGSDEYDQSLSLGLAQSQRVLLKEIEAALTRIDGGTYGVCEALGTPIPKERLNATPWARYSVEGARMADRGALPS